MPMPSIIESLIVGRTPLGGAVRAGLIGVLATTIGTWFFIGSFGPLVVGAVVVLIVLPVAYAISRRDDPYQPPAGGGAGGPGGGSVPRLPGDDAA